MSEKYVMALDQGTTSSRAILFDRDQNMISVCQKEFTQIYPQEGWVEHDPMEIWSSQYGVMMEAVAQSGVSAEEIAEKEHDEAVQKVLDGYAKLGIAGVSGYLNVRMNPEPYGEVVGKLLSGGACEINDTSTDGW